MPSSHSPQDERGTRGDASSYSGRRSRRPPSPSRGGHGDRHQARDRQLSDNGRRRATDLGAGHGLESRLRSPSPYRRRSREEEYNIDTRSPKRQRRVTLTSSPDPGRRYSQEDYKRPMRRTSRSRSPLENNGEDEWKSGRRRSRRGSPNANPDSYQRSRRRSSRSPSPRRRRRRRDDSPLSSDHHRRSRDKSRSPHDRHHISRKDHHASASPPPIRSKGPLPSQQAAFPGNTTIIKPDAPPPTEKQKPNYAPTGLLAAETNTVTNGSSAIILKYHEPPEARLPPSSAAWRLYIFKGKDLLETLELHTRSCWLFGRERVVVDVPVEHPSASKQHAVVQFRHLERKNEWGERKGEVKPYVIDLDSANGTKVNGEKVEGRRYVELRTGDVLGFGESSREYVLLLPPKG